MKKFINSQETITDEELVGFGLAYGRYLNRRRSYRSKQRS